MIRFEKFLVSFMILLCFFAHNAYSQTFDNKFSTKKVKFDNLDNYDYFIEKSKITTESAFCSVNILENDNYIFKDSHNFFRINESSVELINILSTNSPVLWKYDYNDIYLSNISIHENHLIVSYQNFSDDIYYSNITKIDVFDISNLKSIKKENSWSFSGSLLNFFIHNDNFFVFTDFNCSLSPANIIPWYSCNDKVSYQSTSNILEASDSSTNSIVNMFVLDLKETSKLAYTKTFIGLGTDIRLFNDSIIVTSIVDNTTELLKLSINEYWQDNILKVVLPGTSLSWDSINASNDSIKMILHSPDDSFALFDLDNNLRIKSSYVSKNNQFIQDYYYHNDNLFIRTNDIKSKKSIWRIFSFEDDSIKSKLLSNFDLNNTYLSKEEIYTIDFSEINSLNVATYNEHYELSNNFTLTTSNSLFNSSHITASNSDIIAIPVCITLESNINGILTINKNTSGAFNLIYDNSSTEDSYFASVPEYMFFRANLLYTVSHSKMVIYNVENKSIIKKIKLK